MARKGKSQAILATGALLMLAATALWLMNQGRGPIGVHTASGGRPSAAAAGAPARELPPIEAAPTPTEVNGKQQHAPEAPRLSPGQQVEVGLSEPPAAWYMRAESGGNEQFYRRLVRELGGEEAFFSANLGRAAREFVFQYTELGVEPPSDVRDFLIASSGAIAGDTSFQHVRTTSEKEPALRKAIGAVLSDPPDGVGAVTVGIGEVFTPGQKYSRHIGVVATRAPAVLEPTPRAVTLRTAWLLKGRLLVDWRDLKALVLRPDGTVEKLTPKRSGSQFSVVVMSGSKPGPLDVQFVGSGPRGPGKLFQVRAEVGRDLPSHMTTTLPPDEGHIDNADAAAALAFVLLNADRARHGLKALRWDGELARVATDHSRDMRDTGFFSHRSPTTGMHPERLVRAGYRAVSSAENLALNVSIYEAEQGLMHSLGHRRNILNDSMSHCGVGVVGEEREGGGKRWWVTQLFSRPVRDVDPSAEAERLLNVINDAREGAGISPLAADGRLDDVAVAAARMASSGSLAGVTQSALDDAKARGLLTGRLRAWVATTPEMARLKLPGMLRERGVRRLGVGVDQASDNNGVIGVVLLLAD